jgi:hypothetical protein
MPNLISDSESTIIVKKMLRRIFTIIRTGVTWCHPWWSGG